MAFPAPEVIPDGHAFVETRRRHPNDIKLRRAGFRIEHRPRGKPAVWSRHGGFFTQEEAESLCFGGE